MKEKQRKDEENLKKSGESTKQNEKKENNENDD